MGFFSDESLGYRYSSQVMGGRRFQREFTHQIPKQARVKDSRVSFTFRKHVVVAEEL